MNSTYDDEDEPLTSASERREKLNRNTSPRRLWLYFFVAVIGLLLWFKFIKPDHTNLPKPDGDITKHRKPSESAPMSEKKIVA